MSLPLIRVTVLVDNQAGPDLLTEHGFSLWIEARGKRILFDTGQGAALESNARTLGVDFADTDILVLSHGHYDHTGEIPGVLRTAQKAHVYCHPKALRPRYSIRDGTPKAIGMPQESVSAMEALSSERVHWVRQTVVLAEGLGITGPIPREAPFEDTGGPFYIDPEANHADCIEDDITLWIRTDAGLIVCVGCCHAGLVNTLAHVRRLNDGLKVRAVIGGFHLLEASRERLERTVAALRRFDPDMMVPCHCTGESAVAVLRDALGDQVSPGTAGKMYRF